MHVSRFLLYTSVSIPALLIASSSHALPQGGQVAAGNATITSPGTATTIAQGSDRAVIDWDAFDIGAGEAVTFRQPSASSVTLNRIHDQRPSEIFGSLTANGQVILSNPNGILFGPSSRIDVAGLVATTANIGADAFMRDAAWAFSNPGKAGASIINEGTITARNAGLVALVAPLVVNEGFIGARLGRIQLAAADTFTLDLYGDGLLSLSQQISGRTAQRVKVAIVVRGEHCATALQLIAQEIPDGVSAHVARHGPGETGSQFEQRGPLGDALFSIVSTPPQSAGEVSNGECHREHHGKGEQILDIVDRERKQRRHIEKVEQRDTKYCCNDACATVAIVGNDQYAQQEKHHDVGWRQPRRQRPDCKSDGRRQQHSTQRTTAPVTVGHRPA